MRLARVAAALACALALFSAPSFAGQLDSIPMGPNDKVILTQNTTLSENGAMSNLFVPAQAAVSFDYSVQQGEQLLMVVLTQDQMNELNAGQELTGTPVYRTTVSGLGTRAITLAPGTYGVYLVPQPAAPTSIEFRARGSY
jgi:hypothetical protein